MKRKPATPARESRPTPEVTLVQLHSQEVAEKKAKILEALNVLEEEFCTAIQNVQSRLRELV